MLNMMYRKLQGLLRACSLSKALIQKMELKHKWMYKKYKKINKTNKPFEKDVFWKRLTNAIVDKNIKSFNKNNVDLIRKLSCRDKVMNI